MIPLTFDRTYLHADLTAFLQQFAQNYPRLCQLVSIGKSHEGRDIWLAVLTNADSGPDGDKPAFWVDGNIHATEVSPSTCALYLIHKALTGYGADDKITALLDTRALYVVPRVNPDGAEMWLDARRRGIRSSTRPYPRPDEQDGLHEGDVDGDGRTLLMRVPDPNGPWKVHPGDPRLLIPRDPDDLRADGPCYRLLPEGAIRNYDGVNVKIAPRLEGLDLNRNFPMEWAFEGEQPGSGPYPASEPEARALVQFITDHPNITGGITFHTYSGVYLRPYSAHPDEDFPSTDLWTYQEIGKAATRITGYPAASVFHDFKYQPKDTVKGAFDDWMYDHLGVFAWTCELWNPLTQAGIDMKKPGGGYQFVEWYREHPVDDELKLLKWNDEALDGRGFVNWYPFQHPQLGPVELGGWDDAYCWRNPPPHLLEKEIAPHADFVFWHAAVSPRLVFQEVKVAPAGEGLHHVVAVVQNTGWLPTNVTARATEKKLARPIEVDLALPAGAVLVSGQRKVEIGPLGGRALKRSGLFEMDPTDDRARIEWVVRAPPGAAITLTAHSQRAGKAQRVVTL